MYREYIELMGKDRTRPAFASAQANMERLHNGIRRFAPGLISAFSVRAVTRFASEVARSADEIDNVRQKLGTTSETAQSLKILAAEYGVSFDTIIGAFGRLQNAQAEALTGSTAQQEAFRKLGITLDQLRGLNPEQLFQAVATASARGALNAGVQSAKYDLLGRSANQLNGLLQQVATEGIADINAALLKNGEIVENRVIAQLDKLEQRHAALQRRIKMIKMELAVNTYETGAFLKEVIPEALRRFMLPHPDNKSLRDIAGDAEARLWGAGTPSTTRRSTPAASAPASMPALWNAISQSFTGAFRESGLQDAIQTFFRYASAGPALDPAAAMGPGFSSSSGSSRTAAASIIDILQDSATRESARRQQELLNETKGIRRAVEQKFSPWM